VVAEAVVAGAGVAVESPQATSRVAHNPEISPRIRCRCLAKNRISLSSRKSTKNF
jgi:hypothetical protein